MSFKTIGFNAIVAGVTLASTVATVGQAQAATIFNFDFTRPGGTSNVTAPSLNFSRTIGLETIGVTASGSGQGAANIFQGFNGLGVLSQGDNSTQIDAFPQISGPGIDPLEKIKLVFSPGVRLLAATFGKVGGDDDFSLFVHGNQLFTGKVPGAPGGNNDSGIGIANFAVAGTYFIPQNSRTGTTFEFGTLNSTDDYFLRGVSVKTVPAPALLPGLIGLGVAALRKRKADASSSAKVEV